MKKYIKQNYKKIEITTHYSMLYKYVVIIESLLYHIEKINQK